MMQFQVKSPCRTPGGHHCWGPTGDHQWVPYLTFADFSSNPFRGVVASGAIVELQVWFQCLVCELRERGEEVPDEPTVKQDAGEEESDMDRAYG